MRRIKIASFVLAAMITFTVLEACDWQEQRPEDAIDISVAESELIESLKAEGKDDIEIAEALVAYEDELSRAAESEESIAEAVSGTDESVIGTNEVVADQTDISEAVQTDPSESASVTAAASNPTGAAAATSTSNPSSVTSTTAKPTATAKPSAGSATPKPTANVTTTTTPTATPKPTEAESYYDTDCEAECVRLINQLRKEYAVEEKLTFYVPVVNNLTSRAHTRCDELVDDFSHNSVSGNSGWGEAIYRGRGGTPSASSIVRAWKNSRGHYALLLSGCVMGTGDYASINCGMGVIRVGDYTYAVFGTTGGNSGKSPSSGYVAPTSTPTPVPTNTPVPTDTTVPTNDSLPTETPEPTNTPIPTSTPVPTKPTIDPDEIEI
ncbi:MAG: hypothetical protein IKZ29_03325 [Clostridiales bacterium]|nr:hypothetical protein [Clostridiales bacterium]